MTGGCQGTAFAQAIPEQGDFRRPCRVFVRDGLAIGALGGALYVRRVWRVKAFYEPKARTSRRLIEDAPNVLHRGLYPALRRAGMRKIRFHDLRHSAASLLSQGMDVVSVSRLLGHSSPAITLNVYSHAIR
jgi:integrase